VTPPAFAVGTFAGREGEPFQVVAAAGPDSVELTLTSVTTWGGTEGGGDDQRRFTLLFNGPRQPLLPQHIYRFEHPTIGPFEIFIVPIGPDGAGMRYEAVFA
jgi:hypothetical protein